MMNPRKMSLSLILATGIFTSLAASETTEIPTVQNKSTTESTKTTLSDSKQSGINKESTGRTAASESNEAIRPSALRVKQEDSRASNQAGSKKQDESRQALSATTSRSNQFTLALEPKKINYTLPASIEDAQVELMSLDGKVISSQNHKRQDIGGAIDTTSLSNGHYIIRLVDESGKKVCLTRAVTINK